MEGTQGKEHISGRERGTPSTETLGFLGISSQSWEVLGGPRTGLRRRNQCQWGLKQLLPRGPLGTDRWQAGVLPVADKAELDPEVEPREREQVWDSRNKELSQVIRSGAPGAERDGPGGGEPAGL